MNHKAARPPRLQLLLKAERRIILASTLLVLLTGILVSIAVTLPMYRSIRIQLEEVSLANASARQSSIEHQLDIYQSLAEQFSSRTEIRKRLEAWLNGETSLEQLRQFSLPRLQEPASRIPELAGMFRVSNGKLITALGELSAQAGNLPLQPASAGLAFHALDNDRVLIKASAPIRSTDQRTIGHDVLFFHADSLLHHLHGFSGYGDRAKIFLYQESPQTALGLSAATGLPEQALQREALQPFLQQPQLQQPGIHKTRSPQNDILIVRPFAGMPVHLIISIPEQVFYAPAYHDLLGVHILILLLLVLAILASRLAIRPLISTLTRQTREIEASRAELQLAASVFESTQEAIAITDTSLRLIRANQPMQDMCGCCQGELTGKPLGHCLSITGHDQDLSDLQQALAKHGHWQGEVHHRAPRGGASRTSLLHISTVNDSQGQPLYHVHIFSDITVRTRAEQKARHLAAHDALTGLFNRSSMLERIQDSIQQQQPFAILFIDLDKFKPVNDLHGHRTGDEVLCLTAERLRQLTRKQDVLARMGGDEFLVLLSLSNGSDFIYRIAADITRHLARPFDINGTLIEIESSVGIALYPGHGDNADALTHAADLAMYAAKRSGGNRYCLANGTKET